MNEPICVALKDTFHFSNKFINFLFSDQGLVAIKPGFIIKPFDQEGRENVPVLVCNRLFVVKLYLKGRDLPGRFSALMLTVEGKYSNSSVLPI